jgi:hypothetical protein
VQFILTGELFMNKRSVKRELQLLWSIELLNVFLFWLAFALFQVSYPATRVSVAYAIFLVTFILVQGSLYWLNCLRRCKRKRALESKVVVPLYQFFKYLNNTLLLLFIPIWIITDENQATKIVAVLLWGFAILEQINYFYIRLSYNTKSRIWPDLAKLFRKIFTGKVDKSQIAKEIIRYRQKAIKLSY